MTTAEYWQRLPPFDYVVTYSFNRGPKLQQLIEQTRQELQTARYVRRPALEQQLAALEHHPNAPLLTPEGTFQATASRVARFSRHDALTRQLGVILSTPVQWSLVAGCGPVFRDALVFHASDARIIRVLNICFQCAYLRDEQGTALEADTTVFTQLKALFQSLGQPIADDNEV